MILVSYCSNLCTILWSRLLSQGWSWSWSSADRNDQKVYCLPSCDLYYRFGGTFFAGRTDRYMQIYERHPCWGSSEPMLMKVAWPLLNNVMYPHLIHIISCHAWLMCIFWQALYWVYYRPDTDVEQYGYNMLCYVKIATFILLVLELTPSVLTGE